MSLVDQRPAPVVDLAQVAQLTAVVAALAAIPKAIRDLQADLGRVSGRLSHLFTENPPLAREHESEINSVFWEVRDLMTKVLPEIAKVQVLIAEPRAAIAEVMKHLMREVSRKSFSSKSSRNILPCNEKMLAISSFMREWKEEDLVCCFHR